MQEFPCTQCGLCCQKVGLSELTRDLDRGDGACKYFDDVNKSCTIYVSRPDICRVDLQYKINYSQDYSWGEFVELNLEACRKLELLEL